MATGETHSGLAGLEKAVPERGQYIALAGYHPAPHDRADGEPDALKPFEGRERIEIPQGMSGDRPSPARIDQDGVRVKPDAERALAVVEAEHPRGGGGEPGQQARAAPAPGHGLIEHDLHEALETAEAAPRAHDAVYRLSLIHILLDEAGYPVKADGTRFTVTVDYAPGSPTTKMMAEYLKPQLAKVGIDAKIRISPDFGTWAERVSNYNFDITTDNVFNWGDPVIGVHRTYSSANIVKGVPFSNTQQYRNPKVDAIMEQAASEVDNEKRAKLYKEFQQIVMNDVPIYFMTTTAYHTIYNKRVGNVPASIWGFLAPYMDVYLKK